MTTSEQAATESTPTEATSTRKGGAPFGSANAMRHGLRMGKLPDGMPHIGRDLNALRKSLEAACVAQRGSVSVADAATINRATRFERKLRLCERHLALKGDEMASEVYLQFERESARWLLDRDRAISDLELDGKLHRSLYAMARVESGKGEA